MIIFNFLNVKFKISFLFLFLISWFFLYDVGNVAFICFISSLFHELSHILVLNILSAKIETVSFNVTGISIKKDEDLTFLKEFFVLISGCLGNLVLILFSLHFKLKIVLFVNVLILIFNLLPIEKLDGGQILKLFLEEFLNFNLSYKIFNFISNLFSLILTLVMIVLIYYFKETKFIFPIFLILISNFFEN